MILSLGRIETWCWEDWVLLCEVQAIFSLIQFHWMSSQSFLIWVTLPTLLQFQQHLFWSLIKNWCQLLKIKKERTTTFWSLIIKNTQHTNTKQKLNHINNTFLRHTVGSPPVNLILSTPASTNNFAILRISSVVRSCSFGVNSTPFSGMQYLHRKLQRSVILIRK